MDYNNDNINTSNVDKTFNRRLEVKRLAESMDNLLDDIQAAAKLNGFDGPLVGESGYTPGFNERDYDLGFNMMLSETPENYTNDFFYSLYSSLQDAPGKYPRLITDNKNPLTSPLKAHLEVIKSDE
jgi:hypothetical protein